MYRMDSDECILEIKKKTHNTLVEKDEKSTFNIIHFGRPYVDHFRKQQNLVDLHFSHLNQTLPWNSISLTSLCICYLEGDFREIF